MNDYRRQQCISLAFGHGFFEGLEIKQANKQSLLKAEQKMKEKKLLKDISKEAVLNPIKILE